MEEAQEILLHLDELYSDRASEGKILQMCANNPERYAMWVNAFKDYDLSDVLQAIDTYWEFKNSKTKPNVAQIKAVLNAHNTEKTAAEKENSLSGKVGTCIAQKFMTRDIELGKNRHLLPIYQMAVNYVLCDLLLEKVPVEAWRKMSEQERYANALANGLFNDFDTILVQMCRKYSAQGADYQYESKNMLEATGLAEHKIDCKKINILKERTQNGLQPLAANVENLFDLPEKGILAAHYGV